MMLAGMEGVGYELPSGCGCLYEEAKGKKFRLDDSHEVTNIFLSPRWDLM